MLDRGIGIAGIALALIAIIAPFRWPKMPRWMTDVGLAFGTLLMGLAVGLVLGEQGSSARPDSVETPINASTDMNGPPIALGRGGRATVEGNRSRAVGGDAGESGLWAGGAGGDAIVKGDDSAARGGAGSNSPQPDGRGGRRTKSPGELENLPTAFWPYGYGGRGANAPEYNRRLGILAQIRADFIRTFPDDKAFVDAGVDPVPVAWVNKRLEEIGEVWRVLMGDGGYILPPLEVATDHPAERLHLQHRQSRQKERSSKGATRQFAGDGCLCLLQAVPIQPFGQFLISDPCPL